jgi:hypothetical protein
MADCLPRIGPKTRERMARAIAAQQLAALPKPARAQAVKWFTW